MCSIWHSSVGLVHKCPEELLALYSKIISDLNLVRQCCCMSCPVSPVFGFILVVNSIIEQKFHKMLFKRAFTQKCWVVWVHGQTFLCCRLQWGNYPRGKKQIYCKRQPFVSDGDYRFINFTVMGGQLHPPHPTGLSPAQARLLIFF